MSKDKTGIYQIECVVSGKRYIGSSVHVYRRWHDHRSKLNRSIHSSPRLQRAWSKHGGANFSFSILEECGREVLLVREQYWIDQKKPDYNSMPVVREVTPEMRRKMIAGLHRFSDSITHCPNGHEYTRENTATSKRSRHLCRECARIRTRHALARETPEQREIRRSRVNTYHEKTREARLMKQKKYMAARKTEKAEYDRARRLRLKLME